MSRMKKLSLLCLPLMLCAGLLPGTAFADGAGIATTIDATNIIMWIVIAAVALVILILALIFGRKKK